MKRLEQLWISLAEELADLCGVDASRDVIETSRRTKHEGDAFLRITLPAYGKAFDRALEQGRMSSDLFAGFQHRGGFPLFLAGFLRNVFGSDGRMLDVPCTESISAIRQLAGFCGKVEGDCSAARNRKAVQEYIEADDRCAEWDSNSPTELLEELASVGKLALGWILGAADYAVSIDNIVPSHGPGATADGLRGNTKYDLDYWPDHLHSRFPWWEWAVVGRRSLEDGAGPNRSTSLRPAKMSLVPKTMSRPRVIVEEPTALMYMQQGLWRAMRDSIESATVQIGFADQERNREMALSSSVTRTHATLDLSEASDRVTKRQAESVFSALPNLWEALIATRSDRVRLPDGSVRTVNKFASMGSAVCFPVEASVFWVAILTAIRRHYRKTNASFELTWRFLRNLEGQVRVYGDDLIVPVDCLPEVEELFQELGWKINTAKSFSKSYFRESCGGDYWHGRDVTPVRVRRPIPSNRRQIAEVHSYVNLRNQLYLAGYWRTARLVEDQLFRLLNGVFPIAEDEVNGWIRVSRSFLGKTQATNSMQQHLVKAWTLSSPIPVNPASEYGSLLKCLLVKSLDEDHLQRSGRPSSVYTKKRWVSRLDSRSRSLEPRERDSFNM